MGTPSIYKITTFSPKPISVYFQLLLKPKFSGIEKIKTIASTYMCASGLRPGKEDGATVSETILKSLLHNICVYLVSLISLQCFH